jgi:hypothetical protein
MADTNRDHEPIYPLKAAASRVGLSPRTIRLYEEAGLIAPVRVGGNDQRLFSDQDLHWLRCIRDMIHGEKLTVPAIRRLLDLIPCWEIRHCSPEQAALCAAGLNIPDMAQAAPTEAISVAPTAAERPSGGPVELTLIYGVREFGSVMPCSRCVAAERVLRKVADRCPGDVIVTKVDVASPEAARYGVLLPPAILVDDELLTSGQGVSEGRLETAIAAHRRKEL